MRAYIVAGLLFALATPLMAQQGPNRPAFQRDWGNRGDTRGRSSAPFQRPAQELTIDAGYLFLDGQFIARPYVVRSDRDGVTINGQSVRLAVEAPPSFSPNYPPAAQQLQNGSVIVQFGEEPATLLMDSRAIEFLRLITHEDPAARVLDPWLATLPATADQPQWRAWLLAYETPASLRDLATVAVNASDARLEEGRDAVVAATRLQTWAYPLTVFGMIVSVVALGHLLQTPPKGSADLIPSRRRRELCRATVISVIIVALLSGLDLAWTLLASHAGQIAELNPLGRGLIDDPLQLILFKGIATLVSCGLLYSLRRHARAQLATWWMCLVCTLLTFRWLVLSSMFVT